MVVLCQYVLRLSVSREQFVITILLASHFTFMNLDSTDTIQTFRQNCACHQKKPKPNRPRNAEALKSLKGNWQVEYDDQCAECGGKVILDSFRAELVCDRCGLVIADSLILPGLEKPQKVFGREYSSLYYEEADSQLMPQLFFSNKDAQGKPVQQRMVNTLRRTAQIQNLRSRERSAIVFETRLRRLASQQAIPTVVVQRAIFLSRAARKTQVVKKPSLQGWAFSLLLAACRELRFVVTIEDLVGQDEKELSNVRRYYNLLKKSLNLRIHPPSVTNYVTYFSGKFNFNAVIAIRGTQIAKEHKELNSAPHCVAASALYIAAKEYGYNLSQKSFCQKVR